MLCAWWVRVHTWLPPVDPELRVGKRRTTGTLLTKPSPSWSRFLHEFQFGFLGSLTQVMCQRSVFLDTVCPDVHLYLQSLKKPSPALCLLQMIFRILGKCLGASSRERGGGHPTMS